MKVNASGVNLFVNNLKKTNTTLKMVKNASSQKEESCSVKVSISEEGKKSYQNSLQENEKTNYENMVDNRSSLISRENKPETDFDFLLGNKLEEIEGNADKYYTFDEKAANLLEAYASVYNEIVQGYESEIRENYVDDTSSELGYRKLTMEQEIDSLNDAYQKYVSNFEAQAQQVSKIDKAFDKYMKKLSKLDVQRAEMAVEAQEVYSKMNEEGFTENISDKMLNAKNKFVELYSQNISGIDINIILENINVFVS